MTQTQLNVVQKSSREREEDRLGELFPLSIIIPVRNAEAVLEKTLGALSGNSLNKVEILIVDDASGDRSAAVAEELLERQGLPGRCIRLRDHSGPAVARNAGIQAARHPYLLFLDADIILPEQSLHWIRESLELYDHRSEVIGVMGTYSEEIPWHDFLSQFKNLYVCFLYRATDTISPYIHTPICCLNRERLLQAGGFDARRLRAEDFWLGLLLGSQGFRLVIDRRIRGIHLKRYGWKEVFLEDARRIRELKAVRLTSGQRRFYLRAHRWNRLLALALPLPIVGTGVLAPWSATALKSFAVLLLLFLVSHLGFFRFVRGRRGMSFTVKSAAFLFLEMLWAQLVVLGGFFIPSKEKR